LFALIEVFAKADIVHYLERHILFLLFQLVANLAHILDPLEQVLVGFAHWSEEAETLAEQEFGAY
jgi:hypothetical protein